MSYNTVTIVILTSRGATTRRILKASLARVQAKLEAAGLVYMVH